MVNLYRVGGLALVFTFVGVATMFYGHIYETPLSRRIFDVGALITLACLGLFVYAQLSTPVKETRRTRKERKMAEALEEITIELTKTTGTLQALAFKNIGPTTKVLLAARPFLDSFPKYLFPSEIETVAKTIVELNDKIEGLITETRQAVVQKDAAKLRSYTRDVRDVNRMLKRALGNPTLNDKLVEIVSEGKTEKVQTLIDEGADVNAPLILAIRKGYSEIARLLLQAGADANFRDSQQKTALIVAAENNRLDIVKQLIDRDAGVNSANPHGMSALIAAAKNGQADVVETLIVAGADTDWRDNNGMTALEYGRKRHLENVVEILTRKSAK